MANGATTYEMFIRNAFKFALDQGFALNEFGSISRYGDPAGLADTDKYGSHRINYVKAAAAYAVAIYENHFDRASYLSKDEGERRTYVDSIIEADSVYEVVEIIERFNDEYLSEVDFHTQSEL